MVEIPVVPVDHLKHILKCLMCTNPFNKLIHDLVN